MLRELAAISCFALLAGCATADEETLVVRDLSPMAQGELSPQARLYAACLEQAIDARSYGRSTDADGGAELILFSCSGAPAQALYDALADRSVSEDARWDHDGWSYRSANRIERDLFGADWCATDGAAYRCAVNLNLGWYWPGV